MRRNNQVPPKQLMNQWAEGPVSDQVLEPGHGRGIFCLSIQGDSLVTGSADHGLREYNISNNSYKRELFAKKFGHTEWVTSVDHLQDGRVISAGMDSQLCLWDRTGVRCDHIRGHDGSITKVMVDENNVAVSASYDCTLCIWDLQSKNQAARLHGPHKDAVLDFTWNNSLVVSGDKQGVIAIWDINSQTAVKQAKIHKGAVSQVILYSDGNNHNYIISAGLNDGIVAFQDMRTNKLVYNEQIHRGAINGLQTNLGGQVITGSADKTLRVIDIQSGFKPMANMKATDAVFCIETIYNLTVAGCGDGNVLCFENDTGKCLYGFGAMSQGVVRCMKINENSTKLVACGDDFSPMVISYI
ncbi:hypothetical protein ABPG74_003508 [Tetrahymena malaccensis]